MEVDRTELATGLARTRRYLLSHHEPADYHKCWRLQGVGRDTHVCARCTGVYPGILVALLAWWLTPGVVPSLFVVAVLPLPALLDWTVTTYTARDGFNTVRTATGALLGVGYGFGLGYLFIAGEVAIVLIGVAYAVLAALVLAPVIRSGNS